MSRSSSSSSTLDLRSGGCRSSGTLNLGLGWPLYLVPEPGGSTWILGPVVGGRGWGGRALLAFGEGGGDLSSQGW